MTLCWDIKARRSTTPSRCASCSAGSRRRNSRHGCNIAASSTRTACARVTCPVIFALCSRREPMTSRRRSSKPKPPSGSEVARALPQDAEPDMWEGLRQLTAARIGLARSGASLATRPLLDLRLAHARARDAVHAPLDEPALAADLRVFNLPVLLVPRAADDRSADLQA